MAMCGSFGADRPWVLLSLFLVRCALADGRFGTLKEELELMSNPSDHKNTEEESRWLDSTENVRKVIRWFYGLCVLIILADLIFSLGWHKHAALAEESSLHAIETLPAFYGIYGFFACVGLVYVSKVMRGWKGKNALMRSENYWEK